MEVKVVKIGYKDYKDPKKGRFMVATFADNQSGKEMTKSVFDKVDQANCELSMKDGVTVIVTLKDDEYQNVASVVPFISPVGKVANSVAPTPKDLEAAARALGFTETPQIASNKALNDISSGVLRPEPKLPVKMGDAYAKHPLTYAVDLAVAGVIKLDAIGRQSRYFSRILAGEFDTLFDAEIDIILANKGKPPEAKS